MLFLPVVLAEALTCFVPAEMLKPLFVTVALTPGKIFLDFLNNNPITSPYFFGFGSSERVFLSLQPFTPQAQ